MGFTKRELIQFMDELVELAGEENKTKAIMVKEKFISDFEKSYGFEKEVKTEVSYLPLGEYYVKDIQAPAGYVKSDKVFDVDAALMLTEIQSQRNFRLRYLKTESTKRTLCTMLWFINLVLPTNRQNQSCHRPGIT